ncbi:head-tail connector protein [Glacieibacterium frigidum]|uniref:PhiE125 gp8 family phage protein n=1 Tax=Glacieibacterium frigidum TaxID=2593303 RepID=A0A552U819_9SPHN|nr:head-tail connector protein [Glacieibacterium frigidum]TRW14365.1 hypothetical protein FMM06_11680 [Glacieibacterium frigidum]
MIAGVTPVGVDEVKAYLRLDDGHEDAVIAGLVRAATDMAEAFTGRWLIARDFTAVLAGSGGWQRLMPVPVVAITGVTGADGPLPAGACEIDIDRHGVGWVRLLSGDATTRVTVSARAGLAADWNGIPESVRAGIVRCAAQLFAARDEAAEGLPAGVTALWRPWRALAI